MRCGWCQRRAFAEQRLRRVVRRTGFWQRTTDPDRALANLLERDRIFTGVIANDAARNGLEALYVDGTRAIDDMAEELAVRFGLLR